MAVASQVSGLTSSWPLSSLAFWLLPSSSPWELHPLSIDEFVRGHVSYSRDCAASKIFILFFLFFPFRMSLSSRSSSPAGFTIEPYTSRK